MFKMCGRFSFEYFNAKISEQFNVEVENKIPKTSFNVSPGQNIPVIFENHDQKITLDLFKWGLIPHWAKNEKIGSKMINARIETVGEKPAYKNTIKSHRYIIPATGFYEWQKTVRGKIPHYFHSSHDEYIAFGGLYEKATINEKEVFSCTIITKEATSFMKRIHDRMPLILSKKNYVKWISSTEQNPTDLLNSVKQEKIELKEHLVTPLVNNPKNNSPTCIKPVQGLF